MTRILFLTDLHGVEAYLPPLLTCEPEADLVLVGGDLTSFGRAPQAHAIVAPIVQAYETMRGVHGNVDFGDVRAFLEEGGWSLHGRGETVGGLGVFGCGGSNVTPMRTPTEYGEADIQATLEAGLACVSGASTKVVVSHTPPQGKHVGSTAVRRFLESHDLALCLCGHIHEAMGIERVGHTLVVNPGAFCDGRYAVVDVDERGCRARLRRLRLGRRQRVQAGSAVVAAKLVGFARHRLGGSR